MAGRSLPLRTLLTVLAVASLVVLISWTLETPVPSPSGGTSDDASIERAPVRLAPGRNAARPLVTSLEPLVTVRGRVLDDVGRPVSRARLRWVIGSREVATGTTDGAGRYAIRGPELIGDLEVAWGRFHRSTVWLYAEDPDDVTVGLRRGVGQRGVVRAADGSPVAGATVRTSTREFAQTTARTDSQGRFALVPVPKDGSFSVFVEAGHHGRTRVEHVLATEDALLEIDLPPTFSARGRVVRAVGERAGEGLAGVRVASRIWKGHGYGTEGEPVLTDEHGAFVLEGLVEEGSLGIQDSDWDREGPRIDVRADSPALLLRVVPSTLSKRTITGHVVDDAGVAVQGAVVEARYAESATSDADGRFRIEGTSYGNVLWTRHGDAYAQVKVPGREDLTGVVLRLARKPSIRGVVVDTEGRALAGVEVEAEWYVEREDSIGQYDQDAVTDGEGRFHATHLGAEACTVTVEAQRHETKVVEGVSPCVGGTDVGRLVVERALSRRGRVVDTQGNPLPQARYRIDTGRNYRWMPVDADGTFEVEVGADGAFEWLRVEAEGHLSEELKPLGPPWPEDLTFVLRPAPLLQGRVVDLRGEGVRGAQIRAWNGPGKMTRTEGTWTDLDGKFRLLVSASGSYDAHVSGTDHHFARLLPVATDDEDVLIRAVTPGDIAGWVVGTDGRPLTGALVRARLRDTCASEEVVSGEDGSFCLQGLEGEIFDLSVESDLEGIAVRPVPGVLVGGEDVWLRAEEAYTISGRVVWPDGTPAVDVDVDAYPVGHPANTSWAGTDEEGHFVVEGLARGPYRLEAWIETPEDADEEQDGVAWTATTPPLGTSTAGVLIVLHEEAHDDEDDRGS